MSGLKQVRHPWALAGLVFVLLFPWLPFVSFSVLGSANLAAYYALVAVSLVVLTGWVGQISLGHAGLVGVGAYVSGHVINGWHVTFPVNILWAAAAGAGVAMILGAVAVRVRGLYLAVATLVFSWMAVEFLFRQRWMTRNGSVDVVAFGEPGTFPYFEWTSRRTYFYAAWAVVAAAILLMANLRDSKTGRAFFAVRGSEVAAASLGISVVKTKLTAFAVSGALAGVAGNMLLIRDQVISPDAFRVEVSLFFLAVAVVGGLSSLGGAVAGSLIFAALNELFFRLEFLSGWLEVVPPLLLTAVLLAYRGGLAAIPAALERRLGPRLAPLLATVRQVNAKATGEARKAADRLLSPLRGRLERPASASASAEEAPKRLERLVDRLPEGLRRRINSLRSPAVVTEERLDLAAILEPQSTPLVVPNGSTPTAHAPDGNGNGTSQVEQSPLDWRSVVLKKPELAPDREARRPLIEVDHVTVRFGGLVAVNDVSFSVREHEIVGLIGPNGAGKTTTFNAIAGLNVPTNGRVSIYGRDVTSWTVDQRARLGVGRTFQAIQLLPQLSVFENLLVATHVHNPSPFTSHLFVGPSTLAAEAEARAQVRRAAGLLELETYLDRKVADLPFGLLRMVELARALVTGARLVMLDEPASGLDNTETERLTDIVRFMRDLGLSILLIEHDVQMVTAVSDYMYVLDYGTLLAEGPPEVVQRDPRVIAAYLGESPDELEEVGV